MARMVWSTGVYPWQARFRLTGYSLLPMTGVMAPAWSRMPTWLSRWIYKTVRTHSCCVIAVMVLDALGYGDFIAGVFGGEGRAAVDVPAGRSLARIDPRLDSNDNLADFIMLDTPSPGALEVVTVPLPPALVLFMSGVAGLAGVSRRLRK